MEVKMRIVVTDAMLAEIKASGNAAKFAIVYPEPRATGGWDFETAKDGITAAYIALAIGPEGSIVDLR